MLDIITKTYIVLGMSISPKEFNNMANELTRVSNDPKKNKKYISEEIIDELNNIKMNLDSNPQKSMNSLTTLSLLMGIYNMSDFSKESIKNMRASLTEIRQKINKEVTELVKQEVVKVAVAEVDGGGRKRSLNKSQKNRKRN